MADTREVVVSSKKLSKIFGEESAVKDLTFSIPRGSIFGLIGPSGCGKTTTVRLLTGIYKPTSGHVTVLGLQPVNFTQHTREHLGYMPQLFALYPELTIRENLHFTASLYGVGLSRWKRIHQLLDFVELREHDTKIVRQISGGMQKRLSLAASLVHNPELIFLDEPTAGIDPILRKKFWDYFKTLQESGRTLIVTTQYVSEAAYCDFIAVLAEGKLLMVDTPEGLRNRAFGGDIVNIEFRDPVTSEQLRSLSDLPFVKSKALQTAETLRLSVEDAGTAVPALIEWSKVNHFEVQSVEKFLPPFDDVFVKLVQQEQSVV
jgi:ABC-2 type transport system ATP-binding protein